MGPPVTIAFGPPEERIPESHLRRFVDGLAPGVPPLSLEKPNDAGVQLLEAAAAMAPSLAAEVLGLRAVILRLITEGCPRAGRRCAWCNADLAPAGEVHDRGCPWLAIINASSWLDGMQAFPVSV